MLKAIKTNWKTSLIGLVTLGLSGYGYLRPESANVAQVGQIVSGLALLIAADPAKLGAAVPAVDQAGK